MALLTQYAILYVYMSLGAVSMWPHYRAVDDSVCHGMVSIDYLY